ncbi:multicopper oxidase domain-containing protein [Bradyrhizobium lablabi]|uniref:multicopper oxidase family protein n=1 Tax=Bradyrhizobium lablabi TaxID=722472 RepID=UPI001BAAC8EE|nr:multicopper oxidase domain-containing protein [Bradyrhizobium lablabi]MBR1120627.1 multicopper oxidase domain-containing protein [Bradyrhizobium lablabi]
MTRANFPLNRREFLIGLGTSTLAGLAASQVAAQSRIAMRAQASGIALRNGSPEAAVWSLGAPELRFRRGETATFDLGNDLPAAVVLNWRGLDGVPAVEPLTARRPLAPGAQESVAIPLRRAGTLLCDMSLLAGDRPSRPHAVVVQEGEAVAVERDEALLIEEWRVRPDGTAIAPGVDPKETMVSYTLNGKPSLDVSARSNERLRLRFINGSPRTVIALKLESVAVTVMAIDSQPAEPFLARNGTLLLAPGSRVDAFVDVTAPPGSNLKILLHEGREARTIGFVIVSRDPPARAAPLPPPPPLPSNGLPAQLDLKNALRVDLPLGGPSAEWVAPSSFAPTAPPVFRAKAGRIVVLALTNRNPIPTVFHLHGHHFRLLDRLDDGWKPFWLDTLAIEPGQTQRIAFAAEYAGRWLLESVAADWAAPRLVRWYAVE